MVIVYRIRSDGSSLIKDRKYHFTTYKQAFVAREFVDWLISRGEASSRIEAVDIGKQLLDAGVFKHGMFKYTYVKCVFVCMYSTYNIHVCHNTQCTDTCNI